MGDALSVPIQSKSKTTLVDDTGIRLLDPLKVDLINCILTSKNNKIMAQFDKTIPYSDPSYAPEPTRWTKFLRQSFIYQTYRFFVLALKVMRIVVRGHS